MCITFFVPCDAFSQWGISLQHAGFLGDAAFGVSYEPYEQHYVSYLLGVYKIGGTDFYQSSLLYRYSRWEVLVDGHKWRPVQFGTFLTYAMNNDRFFVKSPAIFPDEKYYEQTALRIGIEVGTDITFEKYPVSVGTYLRWLDAGIIAFYNNPRRDQQYYVSSSLSIQYKF